MATKFVKGQEIKVNAVIPQGPVEKLRMDEDGNFFYMISWTDGLDAPSVLVDFLASVTDSVEVNGIPEVAPSIFNAVFTDSATGSDAISAGVVFVVAVSETSTASDVVSSLIDFGALVQDIASGSIVFESSVDFGAAVRETGLALDSVSAAFLWNLINDSQGAVWQTINNSGTTVWGTINTSETSNWQTINTQG
jgi:hypothetical protein